ncbi:MAG: flippase-like domain-containing protein [Prevotella sp.]|nr:flippase-like domain-containing protein [Prevotella sp.]
MNYLCTFAPMEPKSILGNVAKIVLPFILGGAILWWMYRGEDFSTISHVLTEEMDWTWMLLSFPFGILAQMFRGWRWKQTLEPIVTRSEECGVRSENSSANEFAANISQQSNLTPHSTLHTPRTSTCIHAVFISYAASLVIPRIGEFSRCAVLKRYDGVSFSKALGTVVTERAVDTLIVMLYSGIILLIEMSVFGTFFKKTGTSFDRILEGFSLTGWLVTAICGAAALILLHLLLKNLSIYNKVKMTLSGIWEGVLSLRDVKNLPLYLFFSVGIWVMYFLHYYLTFFCFDFTANLGIGCALVSFVVANFAVIVPTPNGAGPWHFAIKTMLILYGVADEQALWFVLIVHTVQTLLVIALGVYAWAVLSFTKRVARSEECGVRSVE